MPNSEQAGQGPELLLAGAGRPRPLPLEMRAHLERALLERPRQGDASFLAAGGTQAEGLVGRAARQRARSLPDEARGKLETSLSPSPHRALPHKALPHRATGRRPKWLPAVAAAAALVALAAIGLPSLLNQPNPQRTASKPNVPVPRAYALRGPNQAHHQSSKAPLKGPVVPRANSERPPSSRHSSATVGKSTRPNSSVVAKPAPKAVAGLATAAPVVHSVNPRSGPSAGGNWVSVSGAGFGGGAVVVMFGTALSPQVNVVSAQRLRAVAPEHRPGPVDIVVKVGRRASPLGAGDRYRFNAS